MTPKLQLFILFAFLTLFCGQSSAAESAKPNLILADDLGWADLPSYGNRFHETPRLDHFAGEGMRFTSAYATAVCSPTRAALISGQSTARVGIHDWITDHWRQDPLTPRPRTTSSPNSTRPLQSNLPAAMKTPQFDNNTYSHLLQLKRWNTPTMQAIKRFVKSSMLTCLAALLAFSVACAADNEPPPGYVSLFNGKDFAGWTVPAGDNGHWKIVNGVIDYDARSESSGDKNLWTEREFGDYVLQLDWRIKETPYTNPKVRYILPDGTNARDTQGKELHLSLPDSDSGVLIREAGKKVNWYYQVNIWCWPVGSGEMYGPRTDPNTSPELRAAVTPRTQADKPVGEWNHFEITVRGKTVSVELNGKPVLPGATIPDLPSRGRLALQHHGGERDGQWIVSPSLLQFKNIYIKELNQ